MDIVYLKTHATHFINGIIGVFNILNLKIASDSVMGIDLKPTGKLHNLIGLRSKIDFPRRTNIVSANNKFILISH